MTTDGTILEASHLRRELGREKFVAVDDVSLSVRPGQVHALLGPNGAGKTTTVRMCATLLTPSSGRLTVDGIDAVARPERARARLGVVLGGDDGFYPRSSARDNLLFFADLAGLSSRHRKRAVDEALERVSLADSATVKVGAYSRGMKQRLHIARALLGSPRLLLLDEPTTGLDPDIALQVRDLVREVAASGVGILLTSHSMGEIEELANVISVIGAGRIAVCGGTETVAQAAGVTETTSFTLPAAASGLREAIASTAGDDGDVDIRPRGANWIVTISWKTSTNWRASAQAAQAKHALDAVDTSGPGGASDPGHARDSGRTPDAGRTADPGRTSDAVGTPDPGTSGAPGTSVRPASAQVARVRQRQDAIAALFEGAGLARPVDFVTRPASLEEAYLALADRLSR